MAKELLIEVDFEHSQLDVTLRFYSCGDGEQSELRVQDLYNLAQLVRRGQADDWSERDQAVCRRLWPEISKPRLLRLNPTVVKISRARYDLWLGQWSELGVRVIERGTAGTLDAVAAACTLAIELEERGEQTELRAWFCQGERRYAFRDVSRRQDKTGWQAVIDGRLTEVVSPLPPALLEQLFGARDPVVPTDKLAAHLPTLVGGHLEVLTGATVSRRSSAGQVRLRVLEDSADMLLQVLVDGRGIELLAETPSAELKRRRSGFEIIERQAAGLPALRAALAALPTSPGPQLGTLRLSGSAENLAALAAALRSVPETVAVELAPGLHCLSEAGDELTGVIAARPGAGWCEVDVNGRIGRAELPADELAQLLAGSGGFVRLSGGGWVNVTAPSIAALSQQLQSLDLAPGRQRIAGAETATVLDALASNSATSLTGPAQELVAAIRARATKPLLLDPQLAGVLRGYQRQGVAFLYSRAACAMGCLLADDMGLGKTLQILAWLLADREQWRADGPALIVCPASVIATWAGECTRFTPALTARELFGSAEARQRGLDDWQTTDLYIISYAAARNDLGILRRRQFGALVLDEAQLVKNPDAQITRSLRQLQAPRRVALSGTPLENRLLDLWSIAEILNPGYLGARELFAGDAPLIDRRRLSRRLQPLLLRRTKAQVASELPPRIEEVLRIPMTATQRRLYDAELARARSTARSGGVMQALKALTRLRQVCCHPALLADAVGGADSAKLTQLVAMLTELHEAGHAVLVFSQFTSMLALIETALAELGVPQLKLTGETPAAARGALVSRFNEQGEPSVFLLSLRAAGVGLTLTRAAYVVLFDPWWNPAAERQAIDRAHRIGQDRTVVAYRLVARDSVEERVLALQAEKQQLFEAVIEGQRSETVLDRNELLALLD